MIFRFLLVSDEVETFKREIQIDGDDTFFDLHKIIMECSGYEKAEMTAFYICDDWWNRKQEITLEEIETDSDVDSLVMEDEILSDWLDEEKQRLIFVFDFPNDRAFYMELSEMILGKYLSKAVCTKELGIAPVQFLKQEEIEPVKPAATVPVPLVDDDLDDVEDDDEIVDIAFYGEDDFNPDELDMDGFEGVDGADADLDISEDTDLLL